MAPGRALPAHLLALMVAGLAGCAAAPGADVIAADGALCDISRRLAAEDLRVSCLLGPGDDPHQVQLRPDQSRRLRQAPLLLINGYGLTPALERLPAAVRVAELAVPESPRLSPADQRGAPHPGAEQAPLAGPAKGPGLGDAAQDASHDASHDHPISGDRDPHVWHDPRQAAAVVELVSRRLQALRPQAAARIQARSLALQASLSALDRWNREQIATIPQPRILASGHRAFASLARAYGLSELAVLDAGSASTSLRPQGLADGVDQLRRGRVRALFSERLPASRSLRRISALSGVPIAPAALPADHGGDDLMATLTANTCLISQQLGGRCDQADRQRLLRDWRAIH